MLGEVDCGFLIWLLSKSKNISVRKLLRKSIQNLLNFILQINNYDIKNIIVCGATLPTVKIFIYNRSVN